MAKNISVTGSKAQKESRGIPEAIHQSACACSCVCALGSMMAHMLIKIPDFLIILGPNIIRKLGISELILLNGLRAFDILGLTSKREK